MINDSAKLLKLTKDPLNMNCDPDFPTSLQTLYPHSHIKIPFLFIYLFLASANFILSHTYDSFLSSNSIFTLYKYISFAIKNNISFPEI